MWYAKGINTRATVLLIILLLNHDSNITLSFRLSKLFFSLLCLIILRSDGNLSYFNQQHLAFPPIPTH